MKIDISDYTLCDGTEIKFTDNSIYAEVPKYELDIDRIHNDIIRKIIKTIDKLNLAKVSYYIQLDFSSNNLHLRIQNNDTVFFKLKVIESISDADMLWDFYNVIIGHNRIVKSIRQWSKRPPKH